MKSRLLYGMTASLVVVIVAIALGFLTDAQFVDMLHYRYVGLKDMHPSLYLLSYDDTDYVLSRSYPITHEFIKVAWNGDTVYRTGEMPAVIDWMSPLEERLEYDSTIIQVRGPRRSRHVVPVSTGQSDLIEKSWSDPRAVSIDTLTLSVRLLGKRLVIEGEKVRFRSPAPRDTSASLPHE